jgi:hypothetical protein
VVIQPLNFQGQPGLMLRVISGRRPIEDDLILLMVGRESNTWPDRIEHLRKTSFRQTFERLAESLRVEFATQTNPALQKPGPARTRLRDEIVAHFEAGLTKHLEVKRPGRAARSTAKDRRALLAEYKICMEAIRTRNGLPSWVSSELKKHAHQDAWKIALQWAAKKQRLNYKLSYLEKVFTRAKRENSDFATTKGASPSKSTLQSQLALSVDK